MKILEGFQVMYRFSCVSVRWTGEREIERKQVVEHCVPESMPENWHKRYRLVRVLCNMYRACLNCTYRTRRNIGRCAFRLPPHKFIRAPYVLCRRFMITLAHLLSIIPFMRFFFNLNITYLFITYLHSLMDVKLYFFDSWILIFRLK